MQTIYIDIYFLINFTVDLLSLHLASVFTRIRVSPFGIILSSFFGGAVALVFIFVPENLMIFLGGSAVYFLLVLLLCAKGCRPVRKIKFIISFLMMQTAIGGIVFFVYGALERAVGNNRFEELENNRNLLVMALIVLLSIGVLKILLILFRNNMSMSNVKLKIVVFEKEFFLDALVDSGSFAKDPMDMSPVMLVKASFAKKIFPYGVPDILETQAISDRIKKRIRAVPISTASSSTILCGFRPDSVFVVKKYGLERIKLTIAFDKEGGSFAGFDALIPYAALENT